MIDGPQDLRVVAVAPTTLELNWLRPQAEVDRFVVSYVSAGNQRVRLEVPSEADGTLLVHRSLLSSTELRNLRLLLVLHWQIC